MTQGFLRGMVVLLVLIGAACGQPAPGDRPMEAPSVAPADTASVQTYEAVGRVTTIMANKHFVIIQHEAIPGYMDAMSMPFAVEDTTLLDGIAARDSVRFWFDAAPGQVVIRTLEKME